MKHLKKRLKKKTVEAYSCAPCGTPDDCAYVCAGDVLNMNSHAWTYATGTTSVRN